MLKQLAIVLPTSVTINMHQMIQIQTFLFISSLINSVYPTLSSNELNLCIYARNDQIQNSYLFEIDLSTTATVGDVAEHIISVGLQINGLPSDTQLHELKLIFSHQTLMDYDALLSDIGICSQSIILYSLRGIMVTVSIEIPSDKVLLENIPIGRIELPCKHFDTKIIALTREYFRVNHPNISIPSKDEHYFIGFKHSKYRSRSSLDIDIDGDVRQLAPIVWETLLFSGVAIHRENNKTQAVVFERLRDIHWIENRDSLNYKVFPSLDEHAIGRVCSRMNDDGEVSLQQLLNYSNKDLCIKWTEQSAQGLTIWIENVPIGTTMIFKNHPHYLTPRLPGSLWRN